MLRRLSFLFLTILIGPTQAQIASPSIFSEVKSLNPAVVGLRKRGQITALGSFDKLERTQDHSPILGDGAKVVSETTMTRYSVFRGGKSKGRGITTEIFVEQVNGEVVDKLTSDIETTTINLDASTNTALIQIGLGRFFGIGLLYATYERSQAYNFSFGGSTYGSKQDTDTTFKAIKPGFRFGKTFQFGFFLEYLIQEGTSKSTFTVDGRDSSASDTSSFSYKSPIAGGAVALYLKKTLIELSYERIFQDDAQKSTSGGQPVEQKVPTRIGLIIERRFGRLALGYKGTQISGVFTDIQNILAAQLLFPNSLNATRLEHSFNFSYGSSKGFSFGGSAFLSEIDSEEPSVLFGDEAKLTTTTKSSGFSVKLGFTF